MLINTEDGNKGQQEETHYPTHRLANVLPIHKKNEKHIINNYRPISLLSCVSKVMERVVFKYSFNFQHEHGLLSAFQLGFISGDSTINQLAVSYHVWSTWQKEGSKGCILWHQ